MIKQQTYLWSILWGMLVLYATSCTSTGSVESEEESIEMTDTGLNDDGTISTSILTETTSISFDIIEYDFGDISNEAPVTTSFLMTNTGSHPLLISQAKGSCGCTVPDYPKDPVPPGETREITVSFNPSGKNGIQNKQVTITANTEPAISTLTIKANIISEE